MPAAKEKNTPPQSEALVLSDGLDVTSQSAEV